MKKLLVISFAVILTSCTNSNSYTEQEIEQFHTEVIQNHYYAALSIDDQKTYQELYLGLHQHKEKIYINSLQNNLKIVNFIANDSPEIFWSDFSYRSYDGLQDSIEFNYTYDSSTIREMERELNNQVNTFLSTIPTDMNTYEKVKEVFTFLVNTIDYDLDAPNAFNSYGALVEHRAVCEGYAEAALLIFQKLDIPAYYVTGTIHNGEKHGWNLVEIDGQYYHFDATWGDPHYNNSSQHTWIDYTYLALSEEEILKTRSIDYLELLPTANSTKYQYHYMNGSYFEEYSFKVIDYLATVLEYDKNVSLQFSSLDQLNLATKNLFLNSEFSQVLELIDQTQLSISYSVDEAMNTLHISID